MAARTPTEAPQTAPERLFGTLEPVDPAELRHRAIALEADLRPDHAEDRRGAAELLAAFADDDPALLRRALLGEAGSGSAGRDLLADAIECAEAETAGSPDRGSARRHAEVTVRAV